MYVTVDFICIGLNELWGTWRKLEFQNVKIFPTVGLEHDLSLTRTALFPIAPWNCFECRNIFKAELHVIIFRDF